MGEIERWTLDMSNDEQQTIVGVRVGGGHEPLGHGMKSVDVIPASHYDDLVEDLEREREARRTVDAALRDSIKRTAELRRQLAASDAAVKEYFARERASVEVHVRDGEDESEQHDEQDDGE
jgi:hypothetical protein